MRYLVPALASFTLSFPAALADTVQLPLIIWHGLGDSFSSDGMQSVATFAEEINPGTFVYPISLANDDSTDRRSTFFGDVNAQLDAVCKALASHPILSTAPAVNALGFSQGGQFLRGYVERCNYPRVRNLVTFGSQHNGIADFQSCKLTDYLCRAAMALLKANTWSHYVQTHLVPAQYYRVSNTSTGEPLDVYLENSNFLADINNERAVKNKTYADNIAALNKFAMYLFEDDVTVIPKETGWFAEVSNLTSGEVVPLQNRTIYKEDWLGLKRLDEKGGLEFRTTEGDHMQLSEKLLKKVFGEFFGPVEEEEAVVSVSAAAETAKLVVQPGAGRAFRG